VVVRFVGQIYSYTWGGADSRARVEAKPQNVRIEVTTSTPVRLRL
jgi:hypothetical protein